MTWKFLSLVSFNVILPSFRMFLLLYILIIGVSYHTLLLKVCLYLIVRGCWFTTSNSLISLDLKGSVLHLYFKSKKSDHSLIISWPDLFHNKWTHFLQEFLNTSSQSVRVSDAALWFTNAVFLLHSRHEWF